MKNASIFLVSRQAELIGTVRRIVSSMGHELRVAGTLDAAGKETATRVVDVLLVQLDGDDGVRERLADGYVFSESPPVVVVARAGKIGDAVHAMRAGAMDYVTLGARPPRDLRSSVARALKRCVMCQALKDETVFAEFISTDYRMRAVCDLLAHVADSPTTLLFEGESGTGKTLLAGLVHRHSSRRTAPFMEVSCGTLTETLLESELFGHTRGAFTSAYRQRQGKFEVANGGTVLLDEIGSASLGMQTRLLRVVESGRFERIGDTITMDTDIRIIAVTKSPLEELVAEGLFREDLYHRLNSLKVRLLPLCKRVEDIPLLARRFVRMFAGKHKRQATDFEPGAMSRMVHYHWPGNVRELRNVVERAVILTAEELIPSASLPGHVAEAQPSACGTRQGRVTNLREAMREPERRCIVEALKTARGNKQSAARALRISRSTLYKKIREHRLEESEADEVPLAVSSTGMS